MDKPEACPKCQKPLTGAQWSLAHGWQGPQPFTQCPHCWELIYLPAPQPPAA